jgi:hypothetical protein
VLTADNWQSIADKCHVSTLFILKGVCKELKDAVTCKTHKFAMPNWICRTEETRTIEEALGLDAKQIDRIDRARYAADQDVEPGYYLKNYYCYHSIDVAVYIEHALKEVVKGSAVKLDGWKVLSGLVETEKAGKRGKERAAAVKRRAQVDKWLESIAPIGPFAREEVYSLKTWDEALSKYDLFSLPQSPYLLIDHWLEEKKIKIEDYIPEDVTQRLLDSADYFKRVVELRDAFAKVGCTVPIEASDDNYYEDFRMGKHYMCRIQDTAVEHMFMQDEMLARKFECGLNHNEETAQDVAARYAHNRYIVNFPPNEPFFMRRRYRSQLHFRDSFRFTTVN